LEATPVSSLHLSRATRQLGRRDEAWLTQMLVKLRVLETHFALHSPRKLESIDHLQMTLKLRSAEIDSLYVASEIVGDLRGERSRR
jgi:hypothetical protein